MSRRCLILFQKEKVDTGTLTELVFSSFSRRCNLLRLEEKNGSDRQPAWILCVNTKDLSFIIGVNNAAIKSTPPVSSSSFHKHWSCRCWIRCCWIRCCWSRCCFLRSAHSQLPGRKRFSTKSKINSVNTKIRKVDLQEPRQWLQELPGRSPPDRCQEPGSLGTFQIVWEQEWKKENVICTMYMYPKESNKLRTCEETGVDIRGWILILLRRWSSKVGLTRAQADQTDEKEEQSSHCCKWVSRMVFMRTRSFHLPEGKFLHANKK